MFIGTSKYNHYHIKANENEGLSTHIYNFSGRIYKANRRQVLSCQIITL